MRLLAVIPWVVVLSGGVVFLATGEPPPNARAETSPQDEAPRLDDASGLVVHEGRLWLVGNKNPSDGTLFSISLTDLWLQDCHATPLPHLLEQESIRPKKARQLEDVDVQSGQIIALSEDRRKVYGKDRALLDYSDIKSLDHKHSRWLEGLTVREVEQHPWQVAVLWEGGQQGKLQRSPFIVFHGVPRELVECGGTLCLDRGSVNVVVLEQKTLQKILGTDS